MTRWQMAAYKGVYTVVLGLIVTPLFGWRALADAGPASSTGPVPAT